MKTLRKLNAGFTGTVLALSVLLALLLMGCPEGEEIEEAGEDGGVSESVKPSAPFTGDMDEATCWLFVTMGDYEIKEIEVIYDNWVPIYLWAEAYAGYTFANHGVNGAGTDDDKLGYDAIADLANWESKFKDHNWCERPVARINLRDAMIWCNAVSEAKNLSPVYRNAKGDILKDATKEVEKFVDAGQMEGRNGYRLLTVDEHLTYSKQEYGAYTGNGYGGATPRQSAGPYDAHNPNLSGAVGGENSNHLFFMNGNSWEWCYNAADKSFALMGGDLWFWSKAQGFEWEPKITSAGDKGSTNTKASPVYGFRVIRKK